MPNPVLLSRPAYQDTYLGMAGLVLYVPLTSATDTLDRVGGGVGSIAGTVSPGRAIPPADHGGSARFTGAASTAITGTNANLPTGAAAAATYSCWVYCTSALVTMGLAGFSNTSAAPSNGTKRGIIANSGKIQMWGYNAGDIITATDYDVGSPQLITAVKSNGTTATVYKNGVSIGTSGALSFANGTTAWWVAHSHGVLSELNNASVSHFAVWNRALTAGEIAYLYQAGVG